MSEAENIHLAQQLHDGIAQDLVSFGYQLDLLLADTGTPINIRKELRGMRFGVDGLINKVRKEIFSLRNNTEERLVEELKNSALNICGAVLGHLEINDIQASSRQEEELLNIFNELLRNCIAHSRATQIDITLSQNNDRLYLEITDNGIGGAKVSKNRFGLLGIQEKVTALGGVFLLIRENGLTKAQITI
jgi:signal transduction histidine kinase